MPMMNNTDVNYSDSDMIDLNDLPSVEERSVRHHRRHVRPTLVTPPREVPPPYSAITNHQSSGSAGVDDSLQGPSNGENSTMVHISNVGDCMDQGRPHVAKAKPVQLVVLVKQPTTTARRVTTSVRPGAIRLYHATCMHSADYAVAKMSVCLSHVSILSKRVHMSSNFFTVG